MKTINLDDAEPIALTAHEDEICSISFNLSEGTSWSQNAQIKVGVNYDYTPSKIYTVGAGLTINGQDLVWRFTPADWNNRDAVYDAFLVRTANSQRDFYGRITVNKSFNSWL